MRTKTERRTDIELSLPPCPLPLHILCLFSLFLPQDTVNALSYLLGGQLLFSLVLEINIQLLDVLFQRGKPPFYGFQLALNVQLFPYHGLEFFIKPRHIHDVVGLQEVQHFRHVLEVIERL